MAGTVFLALACLAYAAPRASAAAPRGFVGLQGWETPSASDFRRIGRARVETYRINLLWAIVEARRGRYDWAPYDAIFASAAAAGVRIMPVVYGTPSWVSRARVQHPPRTSAGRRAYFRFVTAAVRRYGPRGTFWSDQSADPYADATAAARPAVYWQVWNEVNLPNYWKRVSPRDYARFLVSAGRAVRQASARAKVVAAGLAESRSGMPIATFLKGMYRVRSVRRAFDVVAIHPYARDYRGVVGALNRTRAVLRRARDTRKRIWITEAGWATGPRRDRRGFVTSRSGQASKLRKLYRVMIAKRRRYRLLGVVWFSYRDPAGQSVNWWAFHTGLLDARGRKKPAWNALLAVTGGTG